MRAGLAESEFVPRRLGRLTVVVVLLLTVVLAGCASGGPADATPDPTKTSPGETQGSFRTDTAAPEALESVLYQLVSAEDRHEFADVHDLALQDGKVRVVVTLRDGAVIPPAVEFEQTASADQRVEGFVPVDQLIQLAPHQNTTSVRAPERPEPLTAT